MRKLLIAMLLLGGLSACHRSTPRAEPAPVQDLRSPAAPAASPRSDGGQR